MLSEPFRIHNSEFGIPLPSWATGWATKLGALRSAALQGGTKVNHGAGLKPGATLRRGKHVRNIIVKNLVRVGLETSADDVGFTRQRLEQKHRMIAVEV